MKSVFLACLILLSTPEWTSEEKTNAIANSKSSKMSEIEKDVFYFINLVRINPKKFKNEVLTPYLKANKKSYSKKYVRSLKRDLDNTSPLTTLFYTDKLFDFAKHHARTTGKAGKVGHRSVFMKNYKSRTKKLMKTYSYVGENIHYGSEDAKQIVLELLIDDGIKGVGHRKNMLSSDFVYASVSLMPHKKYRQNCVIEFGGKLVN